MIRVGSIVELHYADDPEDETITVRVIETVNDSIPGETLLTSLPLGNDLLGKQVGETVLYIAADGEEFDVEIITVNNSPIPQ